MTDFILHNYPLSPFSEKIRSMLGYAELPWYSVRTKEMPPRPLLAPLAGGYRKIPIGQIGADVFCDTRTISSEIARLSGKPELCVYNCDPEIQRFVAACDLEIFLACVVSAFSLPLQRKAFKALAVKGTLKLLWDRIEMGRKAKVPFAGPIKAREIVKHHLEGLEARLTQNYVFGNNPTIADFSAYHGLWMIRDAGEHRYIAKYPNVSAWMDRIKAFGHGNPEEINAHHALEIAKQATPRPIEPVINADRLLDQDVSIAPVDYGREATEGVLVAITEHQWVILRQHNQTGKVHLHFPTQGYQLQPVKN